MHILAKNNVFKEHIKQTKEVKKEKNQRNITHTKTKNINKTKRQNKNPPSYPPSMFFIMYIIKSLVKALSAMHHLLYFCFIVANKAYSFFVFLYFY